MSATHLNAIQFDIMTKDTFTLENAERLECDFVLLQDKWSISPPMCDYPVSQSYHTQRAILRLIDQ